MLEKIKILLTKNQRKKCIYLFFSSFISTFFEIISIGSIPVFAMIILDFNQLKSKLPSFVDQNLLGQFNQNQIAFFGAIILTAVFLMKNLYLALMVYWGGTIVKDIRTSIKLKLFKTYMNVPYAFHLQTNPAQLTRSVTLDVHQTTAKIMNIISLFKESLLIIMIFLLLFYADPLVSFSVFFFLTLFVTVFFFLTKKKLKIIGKLLQYLSSNELKILNQSFGAIKEITILNKAKYIGEIFKQNVDSNEKNILIKSFFMQLPKLFLEVISVMAIVVIAIIFVFMERSTLSIIPLITLLVVAAIRLIPAFNTITKSLTSMRTLAPSFDHVSKRLSELKNTNIVLDQEKKKEIKFIKDICIKNINFRYPNTNTNSIIDLNLLIYPGKKIGFIGNSGAGKTTIINLLLGLFQPTEGKILIDGKDISENLRNWQNKLGYVPQDIYLLDDTIRNNIALGNTEADINSNQVSNAIKLAQLKSFINSLPNGEETIIGNVGIRLSGGQRQRIGIARALYHNPSILILDEATSSLDVENEQKIMNEIFSSSQLKTLIIITHRHQTVQNCDNIFLLDQGKLIDQGKYDYLNNKHNLNSFIEKKPILNKEKIVNQST